MEDDKPSAYKRAKDEYDQLCETIRVHGNLRYAILTIFVALSGGLVYILFGADSYFSSSAALTFKFFGIAIAVVFWLNEYRTRVWHMHFQARAVELEYDVLDFHSFRTPPDSKSVNNQSTTTREPSQSDSLSTIAIWIIYVGAIAFWIITLICPEEFQRVTKEEKSAPRQHGAQKTLDER